MILPSQTIYWIQRYRAMSRLTRGYSEMFRLMSHRCSASSRCSEAWWGHSGRTMWTSMGQTSSVAAANFRQRSQQFGWMPRVSTPRRPGSTWRAHCTTLTINGLKQHADVAEASCRLGNSSFLRGQIHLKVNRARRPCKGSRHRDSRKHTKCTPAPRAKQAQRMALPLRTGATTPRTGEREGSVRQTWVWASAHLLRSNLVPLSSQRRRPQSVVRE